MSKTLLHTYSPGERIAYERGVKEGREEMERRHQRLPVETWRWQLGDNSYAQINFYGEVPTRREVAMLREFLALTEKVYDAAATPKPKEDQ